MSIYAPPVHAVGVSPIQAQEQMQVSLQMAHELIEKEIIDDPGVDIVVGDDFKRHDTLWGGAAVGETVRQGEAEPIITFMDQLGLQSLLMPGEVTFERVGFESTIDLSLASPRLLDSLVRCTLWPTKYGSDHRAVLTEFSISEETGPQEARLRLKHAQWPKIREYVSATL